MGIVGLVEISLQCFDVLAWPLLSLVYPLCCSIRAIETNSISDAQKLNTYWVVFSLILLFEHAFLKLLEWLPLWHYIRIMVAFWLVIPHFDGAFYVHKHLICPCLTMDPQSVTTWFKKWRKESLFVSKDVHAEVERYVKENIPEALERTIACEAEPNFTGTENSKYTSREIKGKTMEVAEDVSGDGLKRNIIMNFKENMQRQQQNTNEVSRMKGSRLWCNICSVRCPGEIDMASHLSARQHKENVQEQQQNSSKAPMKNDLPLWCSICRVRCTGEIDMVYHLSGRKHRKMCKTNNRRQIRLQGRMSHLYGAKFVVWAALVRLPWHLISMETSIRRKCKNSRIQRRMGHLYGAKFVMWAALVRLPWHLISMETSIRRKCKNSRIQGLWCKICSVGSSGQITLAHLNGKKHNKKVQEQQQI